MKPNRMREIRLEMKYSIDEFAELLGLKKPTYQGYETGRRATPPQVLQAAVAAQKREKKFFRELPTRVDAAVGKNGVPNLARRGDFQ